MRIERNLSQDGLAMCLPSRRHLSWVSKVEAGKQEPGIADLEALADALRVSVDWLVRGNTVEETEFVARLRGMEPLMDDRGRREVLAVAQRQVEERQATADQFSSIEQQMIAAGFPADTVRSAIQRARAIPLESEDDTEEGQTARQGAGA